MLGTRIRPEVLLRFRAVPGRIEYGIVHFLVLREYRVHHVPDTGNVHGEDYVRRRESELFDTRLYVESLLLVGYLMFVRYGFGRYGRDWGSFVRVHVQERES